MKNTQKKKSSMMLQTITIQMAKSAQVALAWPGRPASSPAGT